MNYTCEGDAADRGREGRPMNWPVEQEYLELGPRVAGIVLGGFTWGDTPDVEWNVEASEWWHSETSWGDR